MILASHACMYLALNALFQMLTDSQPSSRQRVSRPLLPSVPIQRTGRVCVSHREFGWPCGMLDGPSGAISLDNGTILSAAEVRGVLWFYEEEFRLQLKWQHQMGQMQVTSWTSLQQSSIMQNFEREQLRVGGAQSFTSFRSAVTRNAVTTGW